MPRIFISYRRDDTNSVVGRLYDHLSGEFGEDCVFRDIYSINPGEDFERAINETLKSCEVCLVMIGPRWLAPPPGLNRPRLADPADFVRREIEAALEAGLRVIPVLVERATIPAADALPESLRPLVRRQAVELIDSRWKDDAARLVDTLAADEVVGGGRPDPAAPWWQRFSRRAPVARGLMAANLAALAALGLDLTFPLTSWPALFAWVVDHLPAIATIATALIAVALFVHRGARERPSQGVMRALRSLQAWSERRSTQPLLIGSLLVLSLSIWAAPNGVTISERSGSVGNDFCSRFFVDTQIQAHRVQQCPGDRNMGDCGANAFHCQYYEVRIFTGLLPVATFEASITISGVQQDGDIERKASVTWADGALEKSADPGWVFSWGPDGRILKIGTPDGSVPRMVRILGTRQHDPDSPPPSKVDVGVTVSTDRSTPFSKTESFMVK